MKRLLTYLILLILAAGCGEEITETQKQEIINSRIQELTDVRVKKFDISECRDDCFQEHGKIINQFLDSNILKLEIGHWMNCATSIKDEIGGFEYGNGVLNLLVKSVPVDLKIESNGDTTYTYSSAVACNCYFILNFELSGFQEIPDSIMINNNSVNNHGLVVDMFVGLEEEILDTLESNEK